MLQDRFKRYGVDHSEWNDKVYIYLDKPDEIIKKERILYECKEAQHYIDELQEIINDLKEYQQELYKRYNVVNSAQIKPEIRLKRRRNCWQGNKVFYDLIEVVIYPDLGKEETIHTETFEGKDRHQAIKAFEAYKKSHPGISAVKDIEKPKYER